MNENIHIFAPRIGIMKKEDNEYTIPLIGLPFGHTDYQYVISDKFFGEREYSEVKNGVVNLRLDIEKMETMFVLALNFEGKVVLQCDRCGDDYEQPIEGSAEIYLKYGAANGNEDDDVIFITKNDNEFDVSDLIYEYIILSLPIHRVHQDESECNKDVLDMLYHEDKTQDVENESDANAAWSEMMKQLKDKLDN